MESRYDGWMDEWLLKKYFTFTSTATLIYSFMELFTGRQNIMMHMS
jgi:hypothetical protein